MVRSPPRLLEPASLAKQHILLCHGQRPVFFWPICTRLVLLCISFIPNKSQLPTIIKEIGIAGSANQVQLWSVIPFAIATPFTGEYHKYFL